MVRLVCIKGTLENTNNYSSPVPVVGLYIAAANMVCFLLVLGDVWAGFRRRKVWFPCRFFSLNSVTLTLISIATKIPVDLTTTMPSAQDQMSKLFGTVFICVAMCFMLPSVSSGADFASYADLISLTIFVITVMVNISIQLATGVIFSFIPEHMIILFYMLFLLIKLWFSAIDVNVFKSDYADQSNDMIGKGGDESMLARLRLCYMYSYHCCPQLHASRVPFLGDVTVVCMTCSIFLIQVTVRSYILNDLRFCGGVSDYGWSMWLVIASQSLAVAVITFAIGGRCFINVAHFGDLLDNISLGENDPYIKLQYLFSLRNLPKYAEKSFRNVIFRPLYFSNLIWMFLILNLGKFIQSSFRKVLGKLSGVSHKERISGENFEVFKNRLRLCGVYAEKWIVMKGVADMERCIEINKRDSPEHVAKLLSFVPSSRESSFHIGMNGQGFKISSLHLVLLIEISILVKTPISNSEVTLSNALGEVFEIIHFIDNKLNVSSSRSRLELILVSVIHRYGLTIGLGKFTLKSESWIRGKVEFELESKYECWLCNVMTVAPRARIEVAISLLNDRIHYLSSKSSEVMYDRIKQLFVDMLVTFLAELPHAIFNHLLDNPVEEYQERVRLCLGFICKLESLKSHVIFSRPSGGNITSIFDSSSSPTSMQVQAQGTTDPTLVVQGGKIQEEVLSPEQQV